MFLLSVQFHVGSTPVADEQQVLVGHGVVAAAAHEQTRALVDLPGARVELMPGLVVARRGERLVKFVVGDWTLPGRAVIDG